jgi:hypothetical protein
MAIEIVTRVSEGLGSLGAGGRRKIDQLRKFGIGNIGLQMDGRKNLTINGIKL